MSHRGFRSPHLLWPISFAPQGSFSVTGPFRRSRLTTDYCNEVIVRPGVLCSPNSTHTQCCTAQSMPAGVLRRSLAHTTPAHLEVSRSHWGQLSCGPTGNTTYIYLVLEPFPAGLSTIHSTSRSFRSLHMKPGYRSRATRY